MRWSRLEIFAKAAWRYPVLKRFFKDGQASAGFALAVFLAAVVCMAWGGRGGSFAPVFEALHSAWDASVAGRFLALKLGMGFGGAVFYGGAFAFSAFIMVRGRSVARSLVALGAAPMPSALLFGVLMPMVMCMQAALIGAKALFSPPLAALRRVSGVDGKPSGLAAQAAALALCFLAAQAGIWLFLAGMLLGAAPVVILPMSALGSLDLSWRAAAVCVPILSALLFSGAARAFSDGCGWPALWEPGRLRMLLGVSGARWRWSRGAAAAASQALRGRFQSFAAAGAKSWKSLRPGVWLAAKAERLERGVLDQAERSGVLAEIESSQMKRHAGPGIEGPSKRL